MHIACIRHQLGTTRDIHALTLQRTKDYVAVDFDLVINDCVLIITSVVNVSISFVMSDRAFSYFS